MRALALIDERVSEKAEMRLLSLGFLTLRMPVLNTLSPDICSHPDTLIFNCGNFVLSSADYCENAAHIFSALREECPDLKISLSADAPSAGYPKNTVFNAICFKNRLFCKTDSISKSVLEYAENAGMSVVHTRQGYPRCTTLKLNEEAAITADCGMARTLTENGIRVCKIREGHISLPTRDYGFIGGAAGVFESSVYFLGAVENHPDFELIRDAIRREGMDYLSLSDEELFDGGGILFFKL